MPTEPAQHTAHVEIMVPDHRENEQPMFTAWDIAFWVGLVLLLPLVKWVVSSMWKAIVTNIKDQWKDIKERVKDLEEHNQDQDLMFKDRPTWEQMKEQIEVKVSAEVNKNA